MKTTAVVLVLIALVAVTAISGCTQTDTGPSGELTAEQMEDEAYKTVEQEMDLLEDMSLDDLENELLT